MKQIPWEVFPYLCVSAVVLALVGVMIVFQGRMRRIAKRVLELERSLQAEAAQLTNTINDLKRELAEQRERHPLEAGTGETGLKDLDRAKVIKMDRVGLKPDHIADSLKLPRGEVDLLVKVHRVVMKPYQSEADRVQLLGDKKL